MFLPKKLTLFSAEIIFLPGTNHLHSCFDNRITRSGVSSSESDTWFKATRRVSRKEDITS